MRKPPGAVAAGLTRCAISDNDYYLPLLVRAGHLKPPGKPAPNARKWFVTIEIERMSCDPEWLD